MICQLPRRVRGPLLLVYRVAPRTGRRTRVAAPRRASEASRTSVVATNGVHFHHANRRPLADVLTSVRIGRTVAESEEILFPNAERHLKSPDEMRELFAGFPDAIRRPSKSRIAAHSPWTSCGTNTRKNGPAWTDAIGASD